MSSLTLTKQEIKELIVVRLTYFTGYLITMIVLFLIYLEALRHFFPRILNALPLPSILVFVSLSVGYLLYHNKEYLLEIILRKKRVYKGIIGIKTFSKGEFSFHMDGYIFTVEKTEYYKFKEGDYVEFHMSPSTKHLFKIVGSSEY